jgi:hypothetical protein
MNGGTDVRRNYAARALKHCVRQIVREATAEPTIDLLAELAEPLAEYMLGDYQVRIGRTAPLLRQCPASVLC